MRVGQACFENIFPYQFWSIADRYPDIVRHFHVQIRLMGNFGINGGVPWLTSTDGEQLPSLKKSVEDVSHFLLDCPNFKDNRESLWSNLSQKVIACNPSEGGPKYHIFQWFRQRTEDSIAVGGYSSPF